MDTMWRINMTPNYCYPLVVSQMNYDVMDLRCEGYILFGIFFNFKFSSNQVRFLRNSSDRMIEEYTPIPYRSSRFLSSRVNNNVSK